MRGNSHHGVGLRLPSRSPTTRGPGRQPDEPTESRGASGAPSRPRSKQIHQALTALDATCLVVAWAVAMVVRPGAVLPGLVVVIATVAGMWELFAARLHRARGCALRSIETAGLVRVAAASAAGAWVAESVFKGRLRSTTALLGFVLSFLCLVVVRGLVTEWFHTRHLRGVGLRPVLLVGTNHEAGELVTMLHSRPDLGYQVVGVVGCPPPANGPLVEIPWMGGVDDAVPLARAVDATGFVVAVTALDRPELQRLVSDGLQAELHVQVSGGLSLVGHRRLRPDAAGHDPWFYVEPQQDSRWDLGVKRGVDIVLGSLALVIVSPILLAAAIAIRLEDGGPVLFRQVRSGRDGRPFSCLKLRTMVEGAEGRRSELLAANERMGPLFKVANDPRVTAIGRFLRDTSIDELPQLVNVVRGDMSLVGPRPALPHEFAAFDDELKARSRLRPGLTGLWQVEARTNPSFVAYRHLDLFYVHNRCLALDLAIIAITPPKLGVQAIRAMRHGATPGPVVLPAATDNRPGLEVS